MLVLGRREGGIIYITLEDGREITVSLLRIDGKSVFLGFDAPESISIVRKEVRLREERQKRDANQLNDEPLASAIAV